MSTPFHKKLRIFLEELDKIIEKYEIYFDKNKDYKSYKRNVASQGGDPEISDSYMNHLVEEFIGLKTYISNNQPFYYQPYNINIPKNLSILLDEIIFDVDLSYNIDNIDNFANIKDEQDNKPYLDNIRYLYLINVCILSIIIQRTTYSMLGISNKLIDLARKRDRTFYQKFEEIKQELTDLKRANISLFEYLKRQSIDRFEDLLSRLNNINKKIEEQIEEKINPTKIIKSNISVHLEGENSNEALFDLSPPKEAVKKLPKKKRQRQKSKMSNNSNAASPRTSQVVYPSKLEASPMSPSEPLKRSSSTNSKEASPRTSPVVYKSKLEASPRTPSKPLKRSPSEVFLNILNSIEEKLFNKTITNYDFEKIISDFLELKRPQKLTVAETLLIQSIEQKIQSLLYISKKVKGKESDKNYLRRICDTDYNKYILNDIIKKINSYKNNIIVKENFGITQVCNEPEEEIQIQIDEKNTTLIFKPHFFKHFFEYSDCTYENYTALINIIKDIFKNHPRMQHKNFFSIFIRGKKKNKIYQLDGEFKLSQSKRKLFIFYSIGVLFNTVCDYCNKFIFTDDRQPKSYQYDWVNNRERFCSGLTPVILPRM